MILKPPEMLAVGIKAERGLFHEPLAYGLRPALIDAVVVMLAITDLPAGQETEVVASSDLPPNANVRAVTATLSVGPTREPVDPPVSSVSVVRGGEPPIAFDLSASPPPGPRNVTVALAGGEVFWTQSGPLAPGSYEIPDFAEQLNAYLDRLDSQGSVPVKFLVRTDTAGSASIRLTGVDYTQLQTQAWPNPLDDTVRVDRNVEADFGAEFRFPLDGLSGQGSLRPAEVRLDVGGQLGRERFYGDVTRNDGHELATISSSYSLAQSLVTDVGMKAVGVSAQFRGGEEPEVYAELQPDAGGGPATERPLAQGKLAFAPVEDPMTLVWRYLAFEAPVDIQAGTPYWVVFRSISGEALIALRPGEGGHAASGPEASAQPGAALVNRGGQLWRPLGPSALAVGLVYEPGVDNQSAAVAVALEGGAPLRVDPTGNATSIDLDVAGAASPPVLVVSSYARGTLSIANVVQEFHP